jgi:hypothetical protein
MLTPLPVKRALVLQPRRRKTDEAQQADQSKHLGARSEYLHVHIVAMVKGPCQVQGGASSRQ